MLRVPDVKAIFFRGGGGEGVREGDRGGGYNPHQGTVSLILIFDTILILDLQNYKIFPGEHAPGLSLAPLPPPPPPFLVPLMGRERR